MQEVEAELSVSRAFYDINPDFQDMFVEISLQVSSNFLFKIIMGIKENRLKNELRKNTIVFTRPDVFKHL